MAISTGILGLDNMLKGGFSDGDITLVAGSPGTGKTTIALQFLIEGIKHGEPGVMVTFEYLPQRMYRDAMKKGWDLKKWESEGKLKILCTTPDILTSMDAKGRTVLDEAITEIHAKRVVLDSVTHFEFYGKQPSELRQEVSGFMNHLRLHDITTIITHEIPEIIGPTMHISNFGLEFLVDNVIILRYVEIESEMKKAIFVLKFRGGDHDRKLRHFELTGKGVSIESEFKGVEGVTSGSPRITVTQRARELI
ncbi:MAG: ATPase domain-containing protein [Candidatus Thermoplasmatota archaeon]|nr:ATPase domain-containing protein [Candidatus Thermoplasmatota archaeon]